MKKRCIAVIVACVLFVSLLLPFRVKSYADPFTAGQLASATYALMESFGIAFQAGNATGLGMIDFLTQQIESYVNQQGGSIADVFIGNMAVDAAGKLVIAADMYNSISGFVTWMADKFNLSDSLSDLTTGQANGVFFPTDLDAAVDMGPFGISVLYEGDSPLPSGTYLRYCHLYVNGSTTYNGDRNYYSAFLGTQYYTSEKSGNSNHIYFHPGVIQRNGNVFYDSIATQCYVSLTDSLKWSGENYVKPTTLNPDKEWTGRIGGYSEPDTNLDQLLGDIGNAVADNNLVVDGEIIDVPVPPEPVPTWTPIDDVIDGINQMGEQLDGIGNDIGDISGHLDDMGDQIDGIEQSLEGVQEGIQTQTGVISGALDQAAQDVVDAIGEQTATLDETLTGTAENVQDIAEALQPGQISPRQFDLRGLFPFCIPFDIHNLLQKFNAEPVAPHVQLPFVIQSIGLSYMIDLDFSVFDPVAAVLRTVELIVFAIGLAWATSKVIKW